MRILKLTLLTLILQLVVHPLASWAVPIANLYNTGLDGSGNYLAANANDGNYTVISSPAGAFTPVAVDDTTFPFPLWIANNPTASRWIGPSGQFAPGPFGAYTYRTTFNLPANANLSTAVINGLWATDDPGLDILINGNSTGQTSASFGSLTNFSVTSGFNVGLNTLDFLVDQVGGGPTGLRVDGIRGSYDVPEPTSWLLGALGMGGMFMRRRV
ncbi:MAG: PEP-CTERM sorting domain-containing protein [Bythopirellula sp.]|nr:PEP-CTERM sorting domain-containing protein [Bythopirellula sp.]